MVSGSLKFQGAQKTKIDLACFSKGKHFEKFSSVLLVSQIVLVLIAKIPNQSCIIQIFFCSLVIVSGLSIIQFKGYTKGITNPTLNWKFIRCGIIDQLLSHGFSRCLLSQKVAKSPSVPQVKLIMIGYMKSCILKKFLDSLLTATADFLM